MVKKIALIGCGKISKKHIKAIRYYEKKRKLKLVALCDRNLKTLTQLKVSKVRKYTQISKMLKNEKIDIVSILTPSGLHFSNFMECKDYVKTIIIEKPITLKISDAKAMIKISNQKKIKLFVVLQNRFNPVIKF